MGNYFLGIKYSVRLSNKIFLMYKTRACLTSFFRMKIFLNPLLQNITVCPRSNDPFYAVTCLIKCVTTPWTDGMQKSQKHHFQIYLIVIRRPALLVNFPHLKYGY